MNNFPLASRANRAMLVSVTLVCAWAFTGAPETRRAGGKILGDRTVGRCGAP